MKKCIAGLAAAAVATAVASTAAAAGGLRLQQPTTVRYGSHVVLHGTALGGSPVTLASLAGGKTAQALRVTEAGPVGAFRFEVAPAQGTTYVAQSDFGSARITVNVMPRIGLRRNGPGPIAAVARVAGEAGVVPQLRGR